MTINDVVICTRGPLNGGKQKKKKKNLPKMTYYDDMVVVTNKKNYQSLMKWKSIFSNF